MSYICINKQTKTIIMIKEGKELVERLRNEIKKGKDVDFNVNLINSLEKSIINACQISYKLK